jgi:hypothetical protein
VLNEPINKLASEKQGLFVDQKSILAAALGIAIYKMIVYEFGQTLLL